MQSDNLNNIVVYIKDDDMLQEAREILERYGEKIYSDGFFLMGNGGVNFLYNNYPKGWSLSFKFVDDEEITLPELEQLLKQQYEENKKIAINLTKGA